MTMSLEVLDSLALMDDAKEDPVKEVQASGAVEEDGSNTLLAECVAIAIGVEGSVG